MEAEGMEAEGMEADLEGLLVNLERTAQGGGLRTARIAVGEIQPDEGIRLKCLIPLCEDYGVCKLCPPNLPSVAEFKEALKTYRAALLLVLEEPVANLERLQTDFTAELKLLDLAARLEKQAFLAGMYRAIGLVVGGCKLCDECTPLGEPCRHPYRARPSPEGLGIDLTALARRAGVAIEWPPATKVVFLGLLLV